MSAVAFAASAAMINEELPAGAQEFLRLREAYPKGRRNHPWSLQRNAGVVPVTVEAAEIDEKTSKNVVVTVNMTDKDITAVLDAYRDYSDDKSNSQKWADYKLMMAILGQLRLSYGPVTPLAADRSGAVSFPDLKA